MNRTSEEDRKRLEDFGQGKTFEPTKLAELVNEATQVMGLPPLSANPNDRRAFSYDVLSIAISGPDRPSITLVDTPGLIKSKGKFQSAEDIKTIEKLVKSYIDQDSTIILAVLSATYGHELQQIPSMINKAAVRTLGVITKPDGPGSDSALESAYMDLARNQEMPLGHGWHVVKNRYAMSFCKRFELQLMVRLDQKRRCTSLHRNAIKLKTHSSLEASGRTWATTTSEFPPSRNVLLPCSTNTSRLPYLISRRA